MTSDVIMVGTKMIHAMGEKVYFRRHTLVSIGKMETRELPRRSELPPVTGLNFLLESNPRDRVKLPPGVHPPP